MKRRLDIIGNADGIEAVLGDPTDGTQREGMSWAGLYAALKAHDVGGRLLPESRAVFDAELTQRWGRLVACTREFAAWWKAPERAAAGAPRVDFFVEVWNE